MANGDSKNTLMGLLLLSVGITGLGSWWQIRTLRAENRDLKEQLKALPPAAPTAPQRVNTRGNYG